MKPFLLSVAEYIKTNYSGKFQELCIVLPGRRSIVFLKKQLASQYDKPFLLPSFFSIEDFFQHLTGIEPARREEQLLLLYQIHLELSANKKEQVPTSLYEFAGNAQIMLGDFNEIDSYMVNPDVLFSSLFAIKELSFFGKQEEELTDFQKNYLLFFKELGVYYKQFTQRLLEKNKAYQGLIYRKAAENISFYIEKQAFKKYLFVGFNALTTAEKTLINYLKETDALDYIVDGDIFYVEDSIHEAGRFLREIKKELFDDTFPPAIGNYYKETPKNIYIIGLPQSLTQAKFLHSIVADLQENNQSLESTALVPADESLLLPILHAVDTQHANITMGYPAKETLLYQLTETILLILDNKNKINRKNSANSEDIKLYYKDLFAFFNNPYMLNLLNKFDNQENSIADSLLKNQKLFYSKEDFINRSMTVDSDLQELFLTLFYEKNTISVICDSILLLLKNIYEQLPLQAIEQETLYLLYRQIESLKDILEKSPVEDISSFRVLFSSMVSELNLSFKSEATEGLQIMGLLETRTLDFKNVVMLSVNEGVLPAGKAVNSFIPYDVKQHFGLPSYKGKDAVFSYHFYRLLQRAETVYLLYNLDAQRGDMEKSRFIYQLKNKLQYFENVKITEQVLAYPPITTEKEIPLSIDKTDEMITQLLKRKYSASSINTYLECSLHFYFAYVLELQEDTDFSADDMLQSNVIGTVVHYVLEKAVENGHFKQLTNNEIEQTVREYMCGKEVNLTENDLLYEKNHLVYRIIVRYIELYLKHARSFANTVFIEKTEEKLEHEFFINEQQSLVLKGIIDRIDSENGQKRIVDYKTGSVKEKELDIAEVGELFDGKRAKAFQLMFYAYLYDKQYGHSDIEAEIVSLRKISQQYILSINGITCLNKNHLQEFENVLIQTITSIVDIQQAFQQTENQDHCKYCAYKDLCRK